MAKYDEQFKLKAVENYLAEPDSYRVVAVRFGIEHSLLRRWVASFREHGLAGLARKSASYDAAFKQSILVEIERQGLSDTQAAARYGIRSVGHIGIWRRQYDVGGVDALESRRKGRPFMPHKHPPQPIPKDMTLEQMQEELAYLRAENDYLKKLKALAQAERTEALAKKRKWSKD
jgi:transposase